MIIQLIIIQVATFAVLFFVLRMLFYRHLSVALNRLKRMHEEGLKREEELKKELETVKVEKEKELQRARQEADLVIADAKVKSEKICGDLHSQAKDQAQKIIENASINIEKAEKDMMVKCEERAVILAMRMLQAAFTGQGIEALQHQLTAELITEIGSLEKTRFTVRTKAVRITSAYPLAPADKEALARILSEKTGLAVEIEEMRDEEMIAGLLIQIGALTIDGSMKNKLNKIAPHIKAKF